MRINLKEYDQGFFIRLIREWSGLTQKEFAKLLNKSEKTIQDYESGKINYKISLLKEITEKLNISIMAEKNIKKI